MPAAAPLSIHAPRAMRLRFWQTPDRAARIDCTGLTCVVLRTNLPFTPTLVAVGNPAAGEYDLQPHTPEQGGTLKEGARYWVHIALQDHAGTNMDDAVFEVEAR